MVALPDNMQYKYTVRYKGARVECDSPQAAARLLRELEKEPDHPMFAQWGVDEFRDLTERLQVYPKRLLGFLLSKQDATDEELREHLRLKGNQSLAGVLSGITKVAQAVGIEPNRIYQQHTRYSQGKPVRRYWITSAFKKIAKDYDWPSESDLREPVGLKQR
jgi:hypothetical protein